MKRHRDQLSVDLAKASREAEDQQVAHKERHERAVLFESLYKEGVVSRRELENAQREVRQGEGDLTDSRLKVTDFERERQRADQRLKQLAADKVKKAVNRRNR